jgi:predicted RND superfamily exporter protein
MKKIIYSLLFLLVLVCGFVFANYEIKNDVSKKSTPKKLSVAEMKAELKKWEATPDGIMFKKWKTSPKGKEILADAAKISKQISDSTNMEAIVTSISLPPGSRIGFGVMVKINNTDYILNFGTENANEFKQLHSLKVNDIIVIKSHSVSYAPKYSYPIVACNYVEQDSKIIYKRLPRKNGC